MTDAKDATIADLKRRLDDAERERDEMREAATSAANNIDTAIKLLEQCTSANYMHHVSNATGILGWVSKCLRNRAANPIASRAVAGDSNGEAEKGGVP